MRTINWAKVRTQDQLIMDNRAPDLTNPLEMLRNICTNPHAWPGGYAKVAIMSDGGLLCPNCCRENYEEAYKDTRQRLKGSGYRSGWELEGLAVMEQLAPHMFCDHCQSDLDKL